MGIESAPPLWLLDLVRAVERHEQAHSHDDEQCLAREFNQVPEKIREFVEWSEELVRAARARELHTTADDVEQWIQSDTGGRYTVGDWLRLRAADIEEGSA